MAGYSGTPLTKKLGIKDRCKLRVVNAPEHYRSLVEPLPPGVAMTRSVNAETDVVHLFCTTQKDLSAALQKILSKIRDDAAVWVSWPKKASKVETDITEDAIRTIALPLGFVDIKVCAVDEIWSGLKLVIRKELRTSSKTSPSGRGRTR
jgi:hypothetical protein